MKLSLYFSKTYKGVYFGRDERTLSISALPLAKTLNSFADGVKLELFNNKIDNITKAKNKIFFWDQTFTNTFIYYN